MQGVAGTFMNDIKCCSVVLDLNVLVRISWEVNGLHFSYFFYWREIAGKEERCRS